MQAEGVLSELSAIKSVQPSEASFYADVGHPGALRGGARRLGQRPRQLQTLHRRDAGDQAITHWARALGAVHSGQFELARAELKELEAIRDELAQNKQGYDWATQVEIQRREAPGLAGPCGTQR